MGRKVGVAVPLSLGVGVSCHLTHVAWAEAYTSVPSGILIHPAIWPQQTWAEFFFWGGGCAPLGEAGLSGPRPTFLLSGILIHPTVSLQ